MNVKYCGPALDYSGYGEANRHDIGALTSVGVNVIGDFTKHCLEIADFGDLGQLMRDCASKQDPYKIKILHTTPNIYGRFIEPGKYHIARVFWETDTLPPDFATGVRMCQEIWTGSEFNAQAIRNAGITDIPIYIIPEAIQTPPPKVKPFVSPNKDDYKFYSIFEWTERKNPKALLESFWREFEGVEGVSLTLKVYIDNFTPEKRQMLKNKFGEIKKALNLKSYAPIYIYTHLLNRDGIYQLHKTFDCYVSTHRGEGWGIPQMEAMLSGNLVISTNIGGIHEYIDDVAKLIPCKLVPVGKVDRNAVWYREDQKWGEVDIDAFRKATRWAFENQDKAKELGKKAKKAVNERFSFNAVGTKMKYRLSEINKSLTNTLQ